MQCVVSETISIVFIISLYTKVVIMPLNELYKLMKRFFSIFEFVFELMAENRKIFKRIAAREYCSKCNAL